MTEGNWPNLKQRKKVVCFETLLRKYSQNQQKIIFACLFGHMPAADTVVILDAAAAFLLEENDKERIYIGLRTDTYNLENPVSSGNYKWVESGNLDTVHSWQQGMACVMS